MDGINEHQVAVIGAGPAGLFAARELAANGIRVTLFNRDLRPGGLAEYGIYPRKYQIKDGLRKQFRAILQDPLITYLGNVMIGNDGDLSLESLFKMGFQAVLVTAGAQGTKSLGIAGEDLTGVYHSKDVVYYYNQLPPYSERRFEFGRNVAIIGAGNVMMDLARYLISEMEVDTVTMIARRGPAEVKFDRRELGHVYASLDREDLTREIERVSGTMRELGQDPAKFLDFVASAEAEHDPIRSKTRFHMRFLLSPASILPDENGRVRGLKLEENTLVMQNGETKARGTGVFREMAADSVILAIGDRVDEHLGLPAQNGEFVKHPQPKYPVEGISYEAYDPAAGKAVEGVFMAGWSRQASRGLVGLARKDATSAVQAICAYLKEQPAAAPDVDERVNTALQRTGKPVPRIQDVRRMEEAESYLACNLGRQEVKFATNQEMLMAMGLLDMPES